MSSSQVGTQNRDKPKVGLFVTCLVDLMRPSVGFASIELLEQAGCDVVVPPSQTCCGQPAFNSGDRPSTIEIAKRTIEAFDDVDYVVAPSGSCAGMLSKHYVELFDAGDAWHGKASAFARKTFELMQFLVDVRGWDNVAASYPNKVTYHDSCSSQREMGVKSQPRKLLEKVEGLDLVEMEETEACCGFGGTFSVKYPDISNRMVEMKTERVDAVAPDTLLAGDMGCLLNISGKLKRGGSDIAVRHVAEVLAGITDAPPIGETEVEQSSYNGLRKVQQWQGDR